jgi:hypothetical protein
MKASRRAKSEEADFSKMIPSSFHVEGLNFILMKGEILTPR